MSEQKPEHPNEGGSYTRQSDGSLKRNEDKPAPPAKPDAKPARATKEK